MGWLFILIFIVMVVLWESVLGECRGYFIVVMPALAERCHFDRIAFIICFSSYQELYNFGEIDYCCVPAHSPS
jgi:hypothetical protein